MPVRTAVTAGTVADCTPAEELIDGIEAEYLLAYPGYDTNGVLATGRRRLGSCPSVVVNGRLGCKAKVSGGRI